MDKKVKIVDLNMLKERSDYYYTVIDTLDNVVFMIKNASCLANVESYLIENYPVDRWIVSNRFKIYYNGESSIPELKRIPKKYYKYFK